MSAAAKLPSKEIPSLYSVSRTPYSVLRLLIIRTAPEEGSFGRETDPKIPHASFACATSDHPAVDMRQPSGLISHSLEFYVCSQCHPTSNRAMMQPSIVSYVTPSKYTSTIAPTASTGPCNPGLVSRKLVWPTPAQSPDRQWPHLLRTPYSSTPHQPSFAFVRFDFFVLFLH